MKFRVRAYPTAWKRKFALFPVHVNQTEIVWMGFYENRHVGPHEYQNRPIGEHRTGFPHWYSGTTDDWYPV